MSAAELVEILQATTSDGEPYKDQINLLEAEVSKRPSNVSGNLHNEVVGLRYITSRHKETLCSPLPPISMYKTDFMIKWTCSDRQKGTRMMIINPKMMKRLIECVQTEKKRFATALLGLRYKGKCPKRATKYVAHHANLLIYDGMTRTVERFDPLGGWLSTYNSHELDRKLEKLFKGYDIKYKNPNYCPSISFQTLQVREKQFHHGLCAAWTLWFLDYRLSNAHIEDTSKLVKYGLEELKKKPSMTKFILDYLSYILSN